MTTSMIALVAEMMRVFMRLFAPLATCLALSLKIEKTKHQMAKVAQHTKHEQTAWGERVVTDYQHLLVGSSGNVDADLVSAMFIHGVGAACLSRVQLRA